MKQSTVDTLRQCTDVEQIGDGALRDDIELAEKLCERLGNQEVPWPVLVGILVQHSCDRSGATLEAGVDAVTSRPAPNEGDLGLNAEPSDDAEKKAKKALQMAAARAAKSQRRLANSAV